MKWKRIIWYKLSLFKFNLRARKKMIEKNESGIKSQIQNCIDYKSEFFVWIEKRKMIS